jgi:hypothetical protein
MSGPRRLAARRALAAVLLAMALAAALAASLLAPAAAIAGGERGGGHGGAGTAEPTTDGPATAGPATEEPATAGVPARAHLPLIAALNAVSCPAARLCMVIGSTPAKSTVVLRWNGRSWADVPVPRPATDSLAAIWCGSATSCLAVGETRRNASGSRTVPLAEHWDGYGWTVLPVPNQAHAFASGLVGIDCSAATACTAVGSYTTASGGSYSPPTYALAEGWNGQTWQLEPATDPETKATELSAVSCSSASACTAVGTSTSGGLVAERWNGTAWTTQQPEPSGGAGPGDLNAVSCPTAGSCTVVGDSGGDDNQGLSETWNGRRWGAQGMVAPSDGSTLSDVTCFSAADCLAVGSYGGYRGDVTLAARWNGRSWSQRHTPNVPRPALDSMLGAISCASPTACLATGRSDRACCNASGYSRHDRGLAEWWNGTKWRMLPTP